VFVFLSVVGGGGVVVVVVVTIVVMEFQRDVLRYLSVFFCFLCILIEFLQIRVGIGTE